MTFLTSSNGKTACAGNATIFQLAILTIFFMLSPIKSTEIFGQLTARQLLAPTIEKYGPQYQDVELAIQEFRNGKLVATGQSLKRASDQHAELAPPDVMLALLFLSVGRVTEAESAIDRAFLEQPGDPEALILLADLALRGKKLTIAELAYSRAQQLINEYKKNAYRSKNLKLRILAGLGSLREMEGQYESAGDYLTQWAKLEPKNPVPLGSLARVFFKLKKYEDARSVLSTLVGLEKNAPPVEIAMGRLYSDADMQKEALKSMEDAVKAKGSDIRVRLTVAEWALDVGQINMAKQNVEAAIVIDKSSLGGTVLSARLARIEGDLPKAENLLNNAVLQSPSSFSATNELARVLAGLEDEKKKKTALQYAQRNFQLLQKRDSSTRPDAIITYAWILMQNDRNKEAEAVLNALTSGVSISKENAFLAAQIYARRGKSKIAINALETATSNGMKFPGYVQARKLLEQLK